MEPLGPGEPAGSVPAWLRAERLQLAAWLDQLPPGAWAAPSLCHGWSVHHVAAHLVTPFVVSPLRLAQYLARTRSLAGALDAAARDVARQPPAHLVALLRAHAGSGLRPPGLPLAAPLTDAVVHGADLRWALTEDRGDWGAPDRLRPVLDFLVSRRAGVGFLPRSRRRGLRLVADDQEWRHGTGDEVRGSSVALAMGLLGRAPAFPLLAGEGAAVLQRRVSGGSADDARAGAGRDARRPDVAAPDVAAPGVAAPGVAAPGVAAPPPG